MRTGKLVLWPEQVTWPSFGERLDALPKDEEWEAVGWTALFQGECGLTPGDRTRIPQGGSEPYSVLLFGWQPHFLSWPACLLLHFWPWPWVPRDHHLQVPALKLGALGLPPAASPAPLHVLLTVPPRWLMSSYFLCPVHSKPSGLRPRGRSNCASWMGCFPLSSCRSSGDVSGWWFSSRGSLPSGDIFGCSNQEWVQLAVYLRRSIGCDTRMLQGKEQVLRGVSASQPLHGSPRESGAPMTTLHGLVCPRWHPVFR